MKTGRVDDHLVWWFGCSLECTKSPVRVSLQSSTGPDGIGRTMTERLQVEVV